MLMSIVFALLGAYVIFTGVKLLLTGKLSAREEENLKTFSQKGIRTYKLAYAAFSIVCGLVIIGLSVLRFLEGQEIIPESIWYNVVALAVVAVLVAVFFLIRSKCKKMTDDE